MLAASRVKGLNATRVSYPDLTLPWFTSNKSWWTQLKSVFLLHLVVSGALILDVHDVTYVFHYLCILRVQILTYVFLFKSSMFSVSSASSEKCLSFYLHLFISPSHASVFTDWMGWIPGFAIQQSHLLFSWRGKTASVFLLCYRQRISRIFPDLFLFEE